MFTDQSSQPLVEYGSALAFDAAGRRTAVATSFDGTSIRLHVPGAWLGDAVYPVTVDPLTSRTMLGGSIRGGCATPTRSSRRIGPIHTRC